ncbi:MAG: type IV secretory system conjugative DNA transfer family protein [Clostridia bacterium]|nr:type IV secretory system conjugative DNA transfer family protein [Clostridia bacterium]
MEKFIKKMLINIIFIAAIYSITVVAVTYFKNQEFGFDTEYLADTVTLFITAMAVGIFLLFKLFRMLDGKPNSKKGKGLSDKGKDAKGKEVEQYFSNDFVSVEELKSKKDFNFCTTKNIRTVNKDGVIVRAEKVGSNIEVNFIKPIHTLIIGTTSSGKSTQYIIPTIQLLSMTAAKPSFVITDPKGELYRDNAEKLKKEGYEVLVLDLDDPYASSKWNPLSYAYRTYHRSLNINREVKIHSAGEDPRAKKLIMDSDFDWHNTNWYEFNRTAYADRNNLDRDLRVVRDKLQTAAFTEIQDVVTAVAPIVNTNDANWETVAQKLIQAVILAMLEDSTDPDLNLTEEKFNFYNVYKICNFTDTSGRDTFATLKKYLFEYRDKFSKVRELANSALNNAETTSKNYMGFVSNKTIVFSDEGISFMTSTNEIDFNSIDEKPTAIFVRIPDQLEVRHPLGSLFVTQMYKRLVEKANSLGGSLKRHVYFELDEFGNMPKFNNLGTTLAVARSRGIFYQLVIQSYAQLNAKYGDQEAQIIKNNCPISVYVGSDDHNTNEEFSKILGNKTIEMTNVNTSKGPDGKESKSESKQIQTRPIAYPHELNTFRKERYLIMKSFEPPCVYKNKFTPSYECKEVYDMSRPPERYIPMTGFEEDRVYYDITKRNDIMKKRNSSSSSDDDDDDLFDF